MPEGLRKAGATMATNDVACQGLPDDGRTGSTPHCFSIDVEGFCEGMAEALPVPNGWVGSRREQDELAENIDDILTWLDDLGVSATFFTLGVTAERQPGVVRRIAAARHEVASHGYEHHRLYNMTFPQARRSIERSKKVLEDVIGVEVLGFRAPDFSIERGSLYLLDVIAETGFRYDSSIAPISFHDVYGIRGADRTIHRCPSGVVEFPPSTCKFLGQVIPVLGGGYFRLLPFWISRAAMKSLDRAGVPAMTYIHPYELGPRRPRLSGLSLARRVRHYRNIDESKRRFDLLLKEFNFGRAVDVLRMRGYEMGKADEV